MLFVSMDISCSLGTDVALDEFPFAVALISVGEKQILLSKRFQ